MPADNQQQLEQLGTKQKFWFLDAGGRLCLFKYGREGTGEDWAEKIAAELCGLLQLPHASYDLAEFGGKRGVVTPSFSPAGGRLVFGNEILSYAISGYDTAPRHHRQHHTVGRVIAFLSNENILPPLGWERPAQLNSAASVFLGYLMLDALIGNQDRHDENWGVLTLEGHIYLQPTFDHASSLGRNESDATRIDRLSTRDPNRSMERYVARARSALFHPPAERPLTTFDAFITASRFDPPATAYWLGRLHSIQEAEMWEAIRQVDDGRMSPASKDFAFRMLQLNRKRLSEIDV